MSANPTPAQLVALARERVDSGYNITSHGEVGELCNGALLLRLAVLVAEQGPRAPEHDNWDQGGAFWVGHRRDLADPEYAREFAALVAERGPHAPEHDNWDQGGYCNALVVDADGIGDVCGYRRRYADTVAAERSAAADPVEAAARALCPTYPPCRECLELADIALAAAAPLIAQQTLLDAVREITADNNDHGDWWDSARDEYTSPARWLTARAATLTPKDTP